MKRLDNTEGILANVIQPNSRRDSYPFPLGTQEISSVSDQQLAEMFSTAPIIHEYGGVTVVRLSKSLACKGGRGVNASEAQTMALAASLNIPVPQVYRTFVAGVPGFSKGEIVKGHFIVMDYIPGPTVEQCWGSLETNQRFSVANQICAIINKLQSTVLKSPPGPSGRTRDQKFEGPWFTYDGAGPFKSVKDLESWFNHKIEVCIRLKQSPSDTLRFKFKKLVLTHQDIAPRNLIIDAQEKLWLIDWGIAGVYPLGFEQAAFRNQSERTMDLVEMVLAGLSNRQDSMYEQFRQIQYGLSTGRHL